jgi:hypothetical protein
MEKRHQLLEKRHDWRRAVNYGSVVRLSTSQVLLDKEHPGEFNRSAQ